MATGLAQSGARAPGARFSRGASDDELVAGIRAGEEPAFEALYDRYHRGLLSFCRHMLGSREEAEDALQQVFVDAHRHLLGSEVDVNVRPWLYTVARNRCLSVLRARRGTVALDSVAEPEAGGLAVALEVERRQDLKDMLGDLARLPDDQRAALVLAELGDLPHDDIAVALDVRKEKVKALVFQAREGLMGWREAREADCREIRELIATERPSVLRRAPIRRHVETCDSCAEFRDEVRRQRAALALILPVVPSLALKQSVLAATGLAGAGGTAAGVAASATGGALVAKTLVPVLLAVAVGGGGYTALHHRIQRATARHKPIAVAVLAAAKPVASTTHFATPAAGIVVHRSTARHHAALHRRHVTARRHHAAVHTAPAVAVPQASAGGGGSATAQPTPARRIPVHSSGSASAGAGGSASGGSGSASGSAPVVAEAVTPAQSTQPAPSTAQPGGDDGADGASSGHGRHKGWTQGRHNGWPDGQTAPPGHDDGH